MKKIIYFLILSSILCISCGGSSTIKKGSLERYELKFIKQTALNAPPHIAAIAFAQKLEELSSGTMTVNIEMIPPILSIDEVIEPIIDGTYDMALTAYGYADLAYKIPELEILGQAYLFRDYEHFLKFVESEYAESLRRKLYAIGIINKPAWYFGIRHTTSNKPINSLNDFRGMKLRVPPLDSSIEFAQAMGAVPMPISFGTFYKALEAKFVDGQENPFTIIESAKIHEVQEYIAMTSHNISLAIPLINKKIYNSFSPEQETWFNEALEYAREMCYNISIEKENYLLEEFQNEYGMIVSHPNINELRDAMKPQYEKLEAKFGAGSVYNIIEMD